jgi:hypothetical protein
MRISVNFAELNSPQAEIMQKLGKNKWRFTAAMVEDAPSTRGVYALWENDAILCIGRADGGEHTIRTCLFQHLGGAQGQQSRHATHYSWEICANPALREAEILREAGSAAQAGTRAAVIGDAVKRSA